MNTNLFNLRKEISMKFIESNRPISEFKELSHAIEEYITDGKPLNIPDSPFSLLRNMIDSINDSIIAQNEPKKSPIHSVYDKYRDKSVNLRLSSGETILGIIIGYNEEFNALIGATKSKIKSRINLSDDDIILNRQSGLDMNYFYCSEDMIINLL